MHRLLHAKNETWLAEVSRVAEDDSKAMKGYAAATFVLLPLSVVSVSHLSTSALSKTDTCISMQTFFATGVADFKDAENVLGHWSSGAFIWFAVFVVMLMMLTVLLFNFWETWFGFLGRFLTYLWMYPWYLLDGLAAWLCLPQRHRRPPPDGGAAGRGGDGTGNRDGANHAANNEMTEALSQPQSRYQDSPRLENGSSAVYEKQGEKEVSVGSVEFLSSRR